ncbi:MAG TPA: D-glycerate dehydrogenase [Candidatus Sulfotelmatobacter sp.]|nr:D-glycerate dehydrogenase [Candidatus Sulfotelmatobacter sp.]
MKPRVVVTRRIPDDGIALLRSYFDVDENRDDRPYTPDELAARAAEADALVALLTDRVDEALLARSPKLKIVANVAVGYDNIDLAAAARHGVAVTNTPGVLTDATADFAFTLLLATARRVAEADRYVRAGRFKGWLMMGFLGGDLNGATLGIAGFGRIGQAVARRGRGFGMQIVYQDEQPAPEALEAELGARRVDKDTLLEHSDYVSLHVPLLPTTRQYIGELELRKMKRTAYLVNTSRGPVVDEAALAKALRAGEIAGAGLDVFEREPEVHPELLTLENVVLAPHIASATVGTRTKMALIAAENAIAAVSGKTPPNLVRA